MLKQYTWGVSYIDEACRIHVNGDPVLDPDFDPADADHTPRELFTLQDAHFNVLALVEDANAATAGTGTGGVIERYEFTPYGQRIAIDPDTGHARDYPLRLAIGSPAVDQPYALNDLGHQGLAHDDETALIYNRARMRSPQLGRFIQRDPLGYVDGMSVYEYAHSNAPKYTDARGLSAVHGIHVINSLLSNPLVQQFAQGFVSGIAGPTGLPSSTLPESVASVTGGELQPTLDELFDHLFINTGGQGCHPVGKVEKHNRRTVCCANSRGRKQMWEQRVCRLAITTFGKAFKYGFANSKNPFRDIPEYRREGEWSSWTKEETQCDGVVAPAHAPDYSHMIPHTGNFFGD